VNTSGTAAAADGTGAAREPAADARSLGYLFDVGSPTS